MKPHAFPTSPVHARSLARLLCEGQPEAFLDAAQALLRDSPESFLFEPDPELLRQAPLSEAFPPNDFSLALDFDSELDDDLEPPSCLGTLICLSPSMWAFGSDFGSETGERARDFFSQLCVFLLAAEPSRSSLLRQGLGGALWSSSPEVVIETPQDTLALPGMDAQTAAIEVSLWRQRRLLRLVNLHQRDIEPLWEEDDPVTAFELALFAPGCPPMEAESEWLLGALGDEASWREGMGDKWARKMAQLACETLNAQALERCAPHLGPDDLLARQAWPCLAEACEASWEFIHGESAGEALDAESDARAAALRSDALAEILEACHRCAAALSQAGPPTPAEIALFPSAAREIAERFAPAPAPPAQATAKVIQGNFGSAKK